MSVEAWAALVHMYCTVVKHGCHESFMQEKTPTYIPFHGVRSGMFSEKQARNVQGTLQIKIAGPFTSVHLIEIFNFQYSTCLIQLQPFSNLTSQAFQENSHPEITKTWGVDLYTGSTYTQINTVSAQFLRWIA